jgi:hypothetical protein
MSRYRRQTTATFLRLGIKRCREFCCRNLCRGRGCGSDTAIGEWARTGRQPIAVHRRTQGGTIAHEYGPYGARSTACSSCIANLLSQLHSKSFARYGCSSETTAVLVSGWCILLRLYINEKIKSPLFATISHRVFIVHVSYYMFWLYISHLQVYHV